MKRDLFLPDRQMNRSKRAEPRLWPHERPRIAALAAVCLSVSAFLILARAAHAQELDETWTVTVGGQTAQVRADGSFVVPNVVAADLSPVDFLSDDFLRVVGTGLVNGERAYVTSEPFQIRSGAAFAVGELFFSRLHRWCRRRSASKPTTTVSKSEKRSSSRSSERSPMGAKST